MSESEETVNRPKHYTQYEGFEVMDVCQQLRSPDGKGGWFRGNVFKYLARAGWKNSKTELEDLQKAAHYLQREIDRLGKPHEEDSLPAPIIQRCPVCNDRLYRETDDLNTWFCIGRGHGALHVSPNNTVGYWTPSELKVKSDDYAHYPTTITLSCPRCEFPLQKSEVSKDNFYCPRNHGNMTVIVGNWQDN